MTAVPGAAQLLRGADKITQLSEEFCTWGKALMAAIGQGWHSSQHLAELQIAGVSCCPRETFPASQSRLGGVSLGILGRAGSSVTCDKRRFVTFPVPGRAGNRKPHSDGHGGERRVPRGGLQEDMDV